MRDEKFNGWTNYATWRINLEICDDITSSMVDETFASVSDLAEYLKDQVDDIISNYGELEGLALDYARAFVSDVDWYEIAQSNADELVKAEDENEGSL